ncbi:hypothetical protein D9M70_641250 [compost metagenome]
MGPVVGRKRRVRQRSAATEFRAPDQVALADQPNETAFIVNDRKAADVAVEHDPGCLSDAVVRRKPDDLCRHHIFDAHVDPTPKRTLVPSLAGVR